MREKSRQTEVKALILSLNESHMIKELSPKEQSQGESEKNINPERLSGNGGGVSS